MHGGAAAVMRMRSLLVLQVCLRLRLLRWERWRRRIPQRLSWTLAGWRATSDAVPLQEIVAVATVLLLLVVVVASHGGSAHESGTEGVVGSYFVVLVVGGAAARARVQRRLQGRAGIRVKVICLVDDTLGADSMRLLLMEGDPGEGRRVLRAVRRR